MQHPGKKKLISVLDRGSPFSSVLCKPPPPRPLHFTANIPWSFTPTIQIFVQIFASYSKTLAKVFFVVYVLLTYGCMHFLLLIINTLLLLKNYFLI